MTMLIEVEREYFVGNRGLENSEVNTDAEDSSSKPLRDNNIGQLQHGAPRDGEPPEGSEARSDKFSEASGNALW